MPLQKLHRRFSAKLRRGIFFRIYTGLLLLCFMVAVLSIFLVITINEYRVQDYREELANGVFYVIAESIEHQTTEKQREFWLDDASKLFGADLKIDSIDTIEFPPHEINRINHDLSVVRFDQYQTARIFYPLADNKSVVSVKMTRVDEQQVRALTIFLLNELVYYTSPEEREERLAELSAKFPFNINYRHISEISIDEEQANRLKRDEVVLIFDDSTSFEETNITILGSAEVKDYVLVLGPLSLFKWFPINLIIFIAFLSMFLMSLGVYSLILPLQRKLKALESGLNDVSEGKLDTKLIVVGQDETAKLSATFNSMAEHIKRLIESQRELTRAVSHELRTPVARIRFAVDMLADTDEEESRHTQRDYIDDDIEELNSLIDEILNYAKLEEGSPDLDWQKINLEDLLKQIVKETNSLGKDIKISYKLVGEKVTVEADHRYLHRVVQNLVGNALRYADSEIKVIAGVVKGEAFVCVEDDGHGIAEEDRDKVFVPFARLDDSRTRASGGYGLGLSIVSRICFWFNGSVYVDESSMGGAKFVMQWPVLRIAKPISVGKIDF